MEQKALGGNVEISYLNHSAIWYAHGHGKAIQTIDNVNSPLFVWVMDV